MDFDTDHQITVRLTKSGKAVLFYWEHGETFICSKAMMQVLMDGAAKGNMIKANRIDNGNMKPDRFMNKAQKAEFKRDKVVQVAGDPLGKAGEAARRLQKVGVQDDF